MVANVHSGGIVCKFESMHSATAFFKLLRPVNLLMMVGTMCAMRFLVMAPLLGGVQELENWKWWLSVVVLICLAAAGNIINDYFDLRVDRINKPERIVIGKGVKRRVAMATHHGFNLAAVLLGGILAWDAGILILAAIPVFVAASLWSYSTTFKKQPLIGNFVVAFVVGIVPLWAGLFELLALSAAFPEFMRGSQGLGVLIWQWLFAFAAFAFLLTLMREAQKDLEDMAGDKAGKFRTMPLAWGERLTRRYVFAVGVLSVVLIAAGTALVIPHAREPLALGISVMLFVVTPLAYAAWRTLTGSEKAHDTAGSRWTKRAMAGGILLSIWTYFQYAT